MKKKTKKTKEKEKRKPKTQKPQKKKEQIQALVRVLGFYADPTTYIAIGFVPDSPAGAFMDDFSEASDGNMRPGKRAREVLASL